MSDKTQAGKVTVSVKGRPDPVETREFPRENLVRANLPMEIEVRDGGESSMPTLAGHFSVFDTWTEINSSWEGHFLERVSPRAYDKTFAENRKNIRVLFNHGKDPSVGDKILGPINELRSDDRGAYYEVEMLDTSYNRDLIPGLKKGLYGASFRFKVMREDWERSPERSAYNPDGLPERTIQEAKVMEFGPVTFPAYEGATAAMRSMTDEYILDSLIADPEKLAALLARLTGQNAPSKETPAPATSPERRVVNRKFNSREDYLEWLSSLS